MAAGEQTRSARHRLLRLVRTKLFEVGYLLSRQLSRQQKLANGKGWELFRCCDDWVLAELDLGRKVVRLESAFTKKMAILNKCRERRQYDAECKPLAAFLRALHGYVGVRIQLLDLAIRAVLTRKLAFNGVDSAKRSLLKIDMQVEKAYRRLYLRMEVMRRAARKSSTSRLLSKGFVALFTGMRNAADLQ